MLGSLKHFIVHDIDEEPKNTWSPFVTKVQSKKCPRAEMLLRMMQTQVIYFLIIIILLSHLFY